MLQKATTIDRAVAANHAAVLHFGEPMSFADPIDVITAETLDDVVPALRAVERASTEGFWAVGFVAYEAAPTFDRAFRVRECATLPLLSFGIYKEPALTSPPPAGHFDLTEWTPSLTADAHAAGVERIRDAIAGGYTYQVNYTMRLRSEFSGDDFAFFERLRGSQQAPYAAYLTCGRHRILSASPELFFHRQGDRLVTRPMKGTVPRGRWTEEDDARREWLRQSEKDRAENLMIVDLLRNDLGRIAQMGTVKVDDLFRVETYPTVFQLTSEISATLRPDTSLADIFRALFPCGSVTGAPKISTMGLIADLEDSPRGVYCGAIGYVAPGGDAVFNVAIRTVTVDRDTGIAEYGAGGGITWDSTPEGEYQEALAKAAILSEDHPPFDLLETLCLRDGEYVILDRHLDRLANSARYFGVDLNKDDVRAALDRFAAEHSGGDYRVRLLVSTRPAAPSIRVEGQPLGAPPSTPMVALASSSIDSNNRFLYHKTTHRAVYERHRRTHPDTFDTLLWNERGEVTEFTIGNLVAEIDGVRWTPPIESGLLPGTMRAELLSTGAIRERILTIDDIRTAHRLWLINSVRGWVPVQLE